VDGVGENDIAREKLITMESMTADFDGEGQTKNRSPATGE